MKVWVLSYEDFFYEEWEVVAVYRDEESARNGRDWFEKHPPKYQDRPECWQIKEFVVEPEEEL